MKAIIYGSVHHGNTKKVVEAIDKGKMLLRLVGSPARNMMHSDHLS